MQGKDLVRIGILDCAKQVPRVQEVYGPYNSDIFIKLIADTKDRLGSSVKIEYSAWDVLNDEYPRLSDVDAIIVTGSPSSVYDNELWVQKLGQFILRAYCNYPRVRIFGACFGHQIICHSLLSRYGLFVEKNPKGFELGVQNIKINPQFALNFEACLVHDKPYQMRMQFVHGDHVNIPLFASLPSSWIPIGSTNLCNVQGLFQPGRVLTFQGHVEFDEFINFEVIKFFCTPDAGFTEENVKMALESAQKADDAQNAAAVLFTFITGVGGGEGIDYSGDTRGQ